MAETMMETLRRRRVTTAARSMAMSESNEQQLHNKAEAAKEQLGNLTGIDEDANYVAQLSHHYYEMKARYHNKRVTTTVVQSAKRDKFWTRVQVCCKTAEVTPERYMKAQFTYFHTAFGTTPKITQLATEAAVDRAQAFEGKTTGKVVGNAIEVKADLGALFGRCEKQIREVCRKQKMDRATYYRTFVLTGLLPMAKEFLRRDPVYQEVANGTGNIPT